MEKADVEMCHMGPVFPGKRSIPKKEISFCCRPACHCSRPVFPKTFPQEKQCRYDTSECPKNLGFYWSNYPQCWQCRLYNDSPATSWRCAASCPPPLSWTRQPVNHPDTLPAEQVPLQRRIPKATKWRAEQSLCTILDTQAP